MDKATTSKWRSSTPYMVFCCAVFSLGNLLYGLDVASFGAIQALPSWLSQFGQLQPNGAYKLSTKRKAIMNSVVWPGKLTGTLIFDSILQRLGFKKTAVLVACIQIIALIIELSAKEWQQYCVGRVFAYLAVGIVENIVPAYHAELAPSEIRGFFAGSIQVFVHIGAVWASSVAKAYDTEQGHAGWIIPTAQQLIPGILLLLLVPFCIESPRWLLLRGQNEQALTNINKIRPREDVQSGATLLEIEAIDQANREIEATKSYWGELLKWTYTKRAMITATCFFFNEVTGQQFVNSYGPSFYKSIGLGSKTFTYNIIVTLAGLIACVIAIFTTDRVGRVPLCVLSMVLTTIFNCLVASVGSMQHPTSTQRNTVIASIILINFSAKIGISSQCYVIGSEIGGTRMRKKIMAVGTAADVVSAFLVTFFTPYIQDGPQIQLGARTAYIWMGCSVAAIFFCALAIPELKSRSLEEVDELFAKQLRPWRFRNAHTTGVGARLHQIEQGHVVGKPEMDIERIEVCNKVSRK
ncbi:hypothetical protein M433DRAFT_429307 [Acidomyces richmondensis BFW]|nr:MAG: hypothetical protein FE78DRAFT_496595 [Acidomyces sp. 'richmondensis']KYG42164.1 hypothetical protein M433DRAFT_429307 [Acidomyces richmondensis BFW]